MQSSFNLPGVFDGVSGPGLGFESGFADGFTGAFADAVGSVLDFRETVVEIAEELAVFFHEAEREFLLVIVGPHVGHVDGEIGKIASAAAAKCFAFHGAHVADDFASFGEDGVAEEFEFAGSDAGEIFAGPAVGGDGGGLRNDDGFFLDGLDADGGGQAAELGLCDGGGRWGLGLKLRSR